jgi:mercuric ion transport protein
MAALALITCPCHLPIWIALLGGSALGAALARHTGLAIAAFAMLFVASGWAALRLFARGSSLGRVSSDG